MKDQSAFSPLPIQCCIRGCASRGEMRFLDTVENGCAHSWGMVLPELWEAKNNNDDAHDTDVVALLLFCPIHADLVRR